MFRDGWLTVNGVSSHVITWGGWVEDSFPEGVQILIFMCGVPGITLFYQHFLETIHNILKIPVWTICIAGHELPPPTSELQLTPDDSLYNNVEAQILHKKMFIKQFVPKTSKVYLIGHSFGAKMVLELMKEEEVRSQVAKCLLLMPTIERFKETPRAKFWVIMTYTGGVYAIVIWIWILHNLPKFWTRVFSYIYLKWRGLQSVSEHCLEAMVHLCHPAVFHNVRTLVWNELEAITKLDTEVIASAKDRLKVYFAPDDMWAPLSHCESLRSAVPGLAVEVLDSSFSHAFTLNKSEEMAQLVARDLTQQQDHTE